MYLWSMKLRPKQDLSLRFLESLVGSREIELPDELLFTKAERAVLVRASKIAEEARSLIRARYGEHVVESGDEDTLLAEAEHACLALAIESPLEFWRS